MKRMIWIFAVVGVACFLSGCVLVGGQSQLNVPTVGQQLIDLKKALDQGAITKPEYERLKRRIMDGQPREEHEQTPESVRRAPLALTDIVRPAVAEGW